MRLFSLPDGVIDQGDRAQWVTPPFDLHWIAIADRKLGQISRSAVIGSGVMAMAVDPLAARFVVAAEACSAVDSGVNESVVAGTSVVLVERS